MKFIRNLAGVLAIVGALNWGLVALARVDLVAEIFGMKFGETNAATRIIYGLVGIAGVLLAAILFVPDARAEMASVRTHREADEYSR
jgi:uncharacterized membrane protein YuzA (DUF378 family)